MQNLTVAITTGNYIDIRRVDKLGITLHLKNFKTEYGTINYPALFDIPQSNRLPALAKENFGNTVMIIAVAITLAMESLNLRRPMSDSQIIDLAEEVVSSLNEGDNLSIEDFMLFLQKLTKGEYGEFYEGMDQQKFFTKFDIYRDERWNKAKDMYYERHEQYKELGDNRRVKESSDNPLDIHLSSMTKKVEQLKDQLKEQKDINKRLREDF